MAESVTVDDKEYDDLKGIEERLDELIMKGKRPTRDDPGAQIVHQVINNMLTYIKTGVKN